MTTKRTFQPKKRHRERVHGFITDEHKERPQSF